MTNGTIADIIEPSKQKLASRKRADLERVVQDLERETARVTHDDCSQRKLLWLKLASFGYSLSNDQLCLIVIERLELSDLLIALSSTSGVSGDTIIELVGKYFHFDANESKRDNPIEPRDAELEARDLEVEENFELALNCYEKNGVQYEHLIRLTMKHLMCSAYHVLEEYCTKIPLLQNIWFEYLMACKCNDEATEFSLVHGDKSSSLKAMRLDDSLASNRHDLMRNLPTRVSEFIVAKPSKWTSKKHLDLISSVGLSLKLDQKILMAEMAQYHLERHNTPLALSLTFCLGEPYLLMENHYDQIGYWTSLDQPSRGCSCLHSASTIASFTRDFSTLHHMERFELIKSACMSLGLLDELMYSVSNNSIAIEKCMNQTLQQLEVVTDSNMEDRLNSIDPSIKRENLVALLKALEYENNKDLNMTVISILLCALKVFLKKLSPNLMISDHHCLEGLEAMFDCLSKFLDELSFGASDNLVRATTGLVTLIKDKLDALADSETIRNSFKNLVDTVAGRCLIESRYKNAAVLYSQIGDNANAVKSLMRTGEIQTVVDYALSARDITVNRITINFMKHLKADPRAIEDFTARTKL